MKFFFVIFLLINIDVSTSVIEKVRIQFPNIDNLEQAEYFSELLKNETSPEAKGYNAAMNFMKSRYVTFPVTKLKYFKEGKNELDEVIKYNPKNVEIRYLRFLMQKQIPEFLGYHQNIKEDFLLIVKGLNMSNLNQEQKAKMLQNMLLTKDLTSEEIEKLNQLLKNI